MPDFEFGDMVFAKLPEEDSPVRAKIIHENKSGTIRIQLANGEKITVAKEDISEMKDIEITPKPSPRKKSPARSKASGGRGRSPGRKPRDSSVGRKKSPGRLVNKTTPKSPKKEVVEVAPVPARRKSERERKPTAKVESSTEGTGMALRLRKWQPTPTKSTMESAVDSDGEEAKTARKGMNGDEVDGPSKGATEFCGTFGILTAISLYALVALTGHLMLRSVYLAVAGFKANQTDLIILTAKGALDVKTFDPRKLFLNFPKFDLLALEIYFGFFLVQLLLNFLPIGKSEAALPGTQGPKSYRCNGIINALITLGMVYGLKHYGYTLNRGQIMAMMPQWIVASVGTGVFMACMCCFKASRAPLSHQNPSLLNTGKIYNFCMGSQVNPTFGPLDLKTFLFKWALITVLTLHMLIFLTLEESQKSHALLLYLGMVNFYLLEGLWFEKHFLTAFEITTEGLGLMLTLGYAVYPFYPLLTTNFLVTSRFDLNIYCCIAIAVLYIIGYTVYRASNAEKSEYRKNPLNPALAHLECIPTARGKRLLCSGWWGMVRHPNYFGDIIMAICTGLIAGFSHPLPWLMPISTVLLLVHRANRVDARCQTKYGDSWSRYCEKVTKRVIPKVY